MRGNHEARHGFGAKILMKCVDQPHGGAPPNLEINGHSEEEIGYHVYLMMQAGLVEGVDVGSPDDPSPRAVVISITWAGHGFLRPAAPKACGRKPSRPPAPAAAWFSMS